ncbi:aminotransferase class-III [Pseudarthrobacter chlorophenolicus A6]|uniref:Aminotransferase class-III n=1 Tax=Pseudarthrobacter chlorophenolicus (strain ATCC 700700 / DSM 12829 / CIP 107037 / JCM 12360 / KCTC 9906 / NCIMB 13794 / A6) TaxID=452863 RepID=B8H8G2_PSECP|nr:aminotransferase class III-fold pyridoxal phosphate-dependent enzyme [Pseudarthrobacter chlorophenolicus]ACL38136.1 aminotransferase class-III [Pseudarthrobacter chlorophenolicus A6]SDQ54655.1 glutamate-1-semialdehyde 2,1-aminomutase [Pseudarthrobacter chlorophenolicus]
MATTNHLEDLAALQNPAEDPHLRRGPRGFPLLPGGYGRSTYYTGAPSPYAIKGHGYRVWDDRGRELIDANNNFTSLIHGNAHPEITEAATKALTTGASWGIPNLYEWELAELLLGRLPELDQVRFANSGTEAVMSAIRISRASTGRERVIVTKGGYHGTSEVALVPGGPSYQRGVTRGVIDDVTAVPLNDVDFLRQAVESAPDAYAAIILDLLPNRAGLLTINEEFVRTARELATRYGIVLIIDEVISLRLGYSGFSGEYGVTPDLLTTGKLIGGGFPVGAVCGKAELMAEVDPTRPGSLPHGGTFSGNPVSMAAGSVALRLYTEDEVKRLNQLGDTARDTANALVADAGWEIRGRGSLLRAVPAGAEKVDEHTQHKLWWASYERGLLGSPANLLSLSTPMDEKVVADITDRLADAVLAVASEAPTTEGAK